MREVHASLLQSVDGVVESLNLWQFDHFDAEMGVMMTDAISPIDDVLLDRLTLMIHPVVAGAGGHLFEPSDPVTRLELVDSVRTSSGNVLSSSAKRT